MGMKSGKCQSPRAIWEWENEKQVWPGKGHRVLLHSTGEQDRLKSDWKATPHYSSHTPVRGDAACRKAVLK